MSMVMAGGPLTVRVPLSQNFLLGLIQCRRLQFGGILCLFK